MSIKRGLWTVVPRAPKRLRAFTAYSITSVPRELIARIDKYGYEVCPHPGSGEKVSNATIKSKPRVVRGLQDQHYDDRALVSVSRSVFS
jgi:hypothetical protein